MPTPFPPLTECPEVAPTACPDCGAPRSWDIDMGPDEGEAEWFAWCEPCAVASFASEDGRVLHGPDPEVDADRIRREVSAEAAPSAALADEPASAVVCGHCGRALTQADGLSPWLDDRGVPWCGETRGDGPLHVARPTRA